MLGSKTVTRPRPSDLAAYMASSASPSSSSAVVWLFEEVATPMLRVMTRLPSAKSSGSAKASVRRSAASMAPSGCPTSSSRMANSSALSRATVSPGRRVSWIRAAAAWRRASPAACPMLSLTCLKWSMSATSTAMVALRRRILVSAWATRSVKRVRLAPPVSESWKAPSRSCL